MTKPNLDFETVVLYRTKQEHLCQTWDLIENQWRNFWNLLDCCYHDVTTLTILTTIPSFLRMNLVVVCFYKVGLSALAWVHLGPPRLVPPPERLYFWLHVWCANPSFFCTSYTSLLLFFLCKRIKHCRHGVSSSGMRAYWICGYLSRVYHHWS